MEEVPQPDEPMTAEQEALVSGLSSSDLAAIDRMLLSHTHDRWRKVAMVDGKSMMDLEDRRPGIPDTFYAQRVRKLVGEGALESQGNLAFMRFSEVRRPR